MGINVLSLFDGMSCGRIALDRAGVAVNMYAASEVDKHAIAVSRANYPDVVQLGDVTKWRTWPLDWSKIDLILAGSPCQGFSFAGKQLAFNDPRSALFFVFVDILNHCKSLNPSVKFLLENVRMKKTSLSVISDTVGVDPVLVNSNTLSAQNRPRYYWANWSWAPPADKGVKLRDVLQRKVDVKYCISNNVLRRLAVSDDLKKQYSALNPDKAVCLTARQYASWRGTYVTAVTERRTEEAKRIRSESMKKGRDFSPRRGKELVARADGKANCLTAAFNVREHAVIDGVLNFRKLTPVECERLQNVPDEYTGVASDAQRYKMLGNGWTVDVIAHVLKAAFPA